MSGESYPSLLCSRFQLNPLDLGSLTEYPQPRFSKDEVRQAGRFLKQNICWNTESRDEIIHNFSVANSFRDSHVFPMRSMRQSLIHLISSNDIDAFTSARQKRMKSIRGKLRNSTLYLDQMNDLGGCRAVTSDIDGARKLVETCKNSISHTFIKEWPYMDRLKPSGYRSHHLSYFFNDKDHRKNFEGLRLELQIRTRLQHSWATAVEAIGLFTGENLKASRGDSRWLELFRLMSLEFAMAEGCLTNLSSTEISKNREEIRRLTDTLDALSIMSNLQAASEYMFKSVVDRAATYFLIRYDNKTKSADVETYFNPIESSSQLATYEQKIESGEENITVALVEVDALEKLVDAYPSYFSDVRLFATNLASIYNGREATEFRVVHQPIASGNSEKAIDPRWMRQNRLRNPLPKGSRRKNSHKP